MGTDGSPNTKQPGWIPPTQPGHDFTGKTAKFSKEKLSGQNWVKEHTQSILLNAYCVLDTILGSFTTLPYLILTKAQWEKNYYLHMVQECAEFLSFTSNPLTLQASVALNMSD